MKNGHIFSVCMFGFVREKDCVEELCLMQDKLHTCSEVKRTNRGAAHIPLVLISGKYL